MPIQQQLPDSAPNTGIRQLGPRPGEAGFTTSGSLGGGGSGPGVPAVPLSAMKFLNSQSGSGAGAPPMTQSGARQLMTMKKGGKAISKAKGGYAEGGMRSESTEAAKAGANKKNAQEQFNDFLKDKGDLNTPQGRADRRVWIARGDEELEKVNAAGRNNYDTKNRTGYYDMDEPSKEYEVSDRLKSSPTSIGKSKGGMAKGGNWIAGATKNKGALHRSLGVPQGEKIPAKKLNAAMKSNNPTIAKRARLAETLNSFKKG
jgi:hypothetical protein